jgi:hypothetical protein
LQGKLSHAMVESKIRDVRRQLRGWAKNLVGENKRKKSFLLAQLDFLDMKVENNMLSLQEVYYKCCLHAELTKLIRGVILAPKI